MENFEYDTPNQKIAYVFGIFLMIVASGILLSSIYVFFYLKNTMHFHIALVVVGTVMTAMLAMFIYNLISKINSKASERDLNKATSKYYYDFTDRYQARPLSQELIVNKIDDFDIGNGKVIRALPTVEKDGRTPLLIQINDIEAKEEEEEYDPNEEIYKYY